MKKRNDDSFPQLNKDIPDKDAGFSLVELLIAVIILAIIVVPLLHGFVTSARMNGKARQTQRAITVAQDIMEGLKAYDIEELKAQFNDPSNGFYVMESKLIKGSIEEDTDREQNDPEARPAPAEPGIYYFTLEGVQIQGSEFDALIRIDARNYEPGKLKADGNALGHDNAFNDINMASPGSVMKGKDGSYTQSVRLNLLAAEYVQKKCGLQADEGSPFTFKTFIDRGGKVKSRTITLHLKDGGIDADGNACCDAEITYVYECEYNGVTYPTSGNMSPAVGSGEWVNMQPCGTNITSGNFYLFYYPLYEAEKDNIVIRNDSGQPFRMYIVKQVDDVTEARLSDIQLYNAEIGYHAVVNVEGTTADQVKIRTNLGMNLVNATFAGSLNPAPAPAEGKLPTYEVEKADIPTQAAYQLNGGNGQSIDVFGLSGIRIETVPMQSGTGNDGGITEIIYDIEISVYKKGAKDDGFPDSQRMAYITGSKNN